MTEVEADALDAEAPSLNRARKKFGLNSRRRSLSQSASEPNLSALGREKRHKDDNSQQYRLSRGLSSRGSFDSLKEVLRGNVALSKSDMQGICPHKYHCIQNAMVKGFLRTFSGAYLVKSTVALASAMLSGRVKLLGKDKLRFDTSALHTMK